MQRIDENTYIDDSLVTCAEYQLFIDEMREQGKFYQPDHWTSYRFPNGKAKEPILGVRHSDAMMFCDWLNKSEEREWEFRLPSEEEIVNLPMKRLGAKYLGYWKQEFAFAFIDTTIENPRNFDRKSASQFATETLRELYFIRSGYVDYGLSHYIDLDILEIISNLTKQNKKSIPSEEKLRELNQHVELFFKEHFFNITKRPLDLRSLELIAEFGSKNQKFAKILNSDNSLLKRSYPKENYAFLKEPRKGTVKFSKTNWGTKSNEIDVLPIALYVSFFLAEDFKSSHDSWGFLFFDLFTLLERIAGHSPAFEGIRLIKERIK